MGELSRGTSGGVARRASGAVGAARSGRPQDAGPATDIDEVEFGGTVLTFEDDMPGQFRTGAREATTRQLAAGGHDRLALERGSTDGPSSQVTAVSRAADTVRFTPPSPPTTARQNQRFVIASMVRQLPAPRRSDGRVVQRRLGWQATPEAVIVTTVERELAKRADGRYSPSGPWLIEDRRTFRDTSGKAGKRSGAVPVDTSGTAGADGRAASGNAPGATSAGDTTSSAEADVARRFPSGSDALSMLPAVVRGPVIARVPTPTFFDGQTIQSYDSEGDPAHYQVSVLRMDDKRAVMVHAERDVRAQRWDTTQVTYALGAGVAEQG